MRDILLAHRGKDNAIAAIEISSMLGLPLEATQSTCRKLIHKTANFYHLPLFSSSKGFYIAQTNRILYFYIQNILLVFWAISEIITAQVFRRINYFFYIS